MARRLSGQEKGRGTHLHCCTVTVREERVREESRKAEGGRRGWAGEKTKFQSLGLYFPGHAPVLVPTPHHPLR